MTSVFLNTAFINIHVSTPGAAFNLVNVPLSLIGCYFQNCTSTDHAACFLFQTSIISLERTCFIHSQVLRPQDACYGNVFYIISSTTKYKQISSFLCGYDETKVCDSGMVNNSPLNARGINCSRCASLLGSASLALYERQTNDNISYFTVVSPFSVQSQATALTIFNARAEIRYLNMIYSKETTATFYLNSGDSLTVYNGAFIDPNTDTFLTYEINDRLKLINCTSNVALPLKSGYIITASPILYNENLIIAEDCHFYLTKQILVHKNLNHHLTFFLYCHHKTMIKRQNEVCLFVFQFSLEFPKIVYILLLVLSSE